MTVFGKEARTANCLCANTGGNSHCAVAAFLLTGVERSLAFAQHW